MHEEPLHLIPPELRAEIYKEYGIYIEGDLCPACLQMLKDKYGGRTEDVIVERIAFPVVSKRAITQRASPYI